MSPIAVHATTLPCKSRGERIGEFAATMIAEFGAMNRGRSDQNERQSPGVCRYQRREARLPNVHRASDDRLGRGRAAVRFLQNDVKTGSPKKPRLLRIQKRA